MSPQRTAATVAVLMFSLALPAVVPRARADRRGAQQFGEAKPDKALVYFIRTSRLGGSGRTQYLYADQTFLGVIRSGSYGFAYVEPGPHLFWTNWTHVTRDLELAAGETYYLDVWQTISVVDETRGKALIEEVADFMTPTDNDRSVAADQIQNRYERARKKEARKEKADVATIAAPGSPPENTEGMLKVPANTPITLEILENVCSGLTNTGETVWFRVAADAAVDGSVVLKKDTLVKGTVREAEAAMGGGKEGVLDIVVPALTTRDGSALPTIGQIASAGMERGDASLASGMGFGLIGALAVKGREAYHLAGEKFTVRTRQEAWVHADGPAGETDQTPQAPTASDEGLVLKGRATDPIKFKPRKGKVSDTVEIDLDADAEPREVIVHAFGATEIPEPIKAVDISRHGKGWRCTFNGWEFARHLREDGERTAIPVEMRGALQDGRTFVAEAAVTFTLERE